MSSDVTPPRPDAAQVAAAARIPARLERLPMSSYQRNIFFIIASAWLFDSMDLASMTFLLAPIAETFSLSNTQSGWLGSASLLGMVIGAGTAGVCADRFGRKVIFQTSMIMWGLAGILCGCAWSFTSLLVFRFLLGIGMAAEFPIAQALVSEFMPAKVRGKWIALLEGFWPLGFICTGLLTIVLLPLCSWRGVFIAQGLPAIFVLIIRRRVPESPRWLASVGRAAEAEKVVSEFERQVAKVTAEPLPPEATAAPCSPAKSAGFSLGELFSSAYYQRTLMVWVLWFCALLGYYGITTWMGKLLVEHGLEIQKSNIYIVFMTFWGVPGFFAAAYLVERIGRKPTMLLALSGSALAAYFYGLAVTPLQLVSHGALMQFFFFGMWSVLYAYTPELFPTRARATGCGTASLWGRVGALLGPIIVPLLLAAYGSGAVYTMGTAAFAVAMLTVWWLGPETRGKTLEEISA